MKIAHASAAVIPACMSIVAVNVIVGFKPSFPRLHDILVWQSIIVTLAGYGFGELISVSMIEKSIRALVPANVQFCVLLNPANNLGAKKSRYLSAESTPNTDKVSMNPVSVLVVIPY